MLLLPLSIDGVVVIDLSRELIVVVDGDDDEITC